MVSGFALSVMMLGRKKLVDTWALSSSLRLTLVLVGKTACARISAGALGLHWSLRGNERRSPEVGVSMEATSLSLFFLRIHSICTLSKASAPTNGITVDSPSARSSLTSSVLASILTQVYAWLSVLLPLLVLMVVSPLTDDTTPAAATVLQRCCSMARRARSLPLRAARMTRLPSSTPATAES